VFWSSDSRSLAFIAGGKLKRLDPSGGPAVTVADAPSSQPTPGSWNKEDVILFTPANDSPISRVSATGGAVSPVTVLDKASGETRHAFPFFLPDHRHFLYAAFNGITPLGVYAASLDRSEKRQILSGGSNSMYVNGHLLYLRDTTLMAQPFDADAFRLTGQPTPIVDQILLNQAAPRAGAFAVSQTGVLVYQSGAVGDLQLTWVDRAGRPLGVVGERANYGDVQLSVDGRYASVSTTADSGGSRDVWIVDVARGTRTKFTFDAAEDHTALWSPDSNRVLFNSNRKGHLDVFEKSLTGAGNETLLFGDNRDKQLLSWSRDGRFVLLAIAGDKTAADVWALPLSNDGKPLTPFAYLQTPAQEGQAQFSPDGHWVAYSSNEAGGFQIYVGRFPEFGSKRLLSPGAGIFPRWRADGKEIYYLDSATNKLMAAAVTTTGAALDVTDVRPLFDIQLTGSRRFPYDVAPDGQRFLVNLPDRPLQAATLTMVVNWPALLKSPSSW
jgi:dipeptidyl aminopeptidase/acylaminoacyl peptidase